MKSLGTLLVASILFAASLAAPGTSVHAAGTWYYETFPSQALGEDYLFAIYLPEGYSDVQDRYPVVYFLHGYGVPLPNYWSFYDPNLTMDELIEAELIQPAIFVAPQGYHATYGGHWYTNSEFHGDYEDCVVEDLVEYVDANYRTVADRDHRVLAGHSMGGFGATKLALKHPDVYGAVATHAGVLDLTITIENKDGVIAEADPGGAGPPYEYHPENGGETMITFSQAAAWSPNMDNPPYYVDFPYDENGNIVEDVRERWLMHDPPRLAREYAESSEYPLCIWIGCGTEDYGLMPHTEAFCDSLDILGLDYEFVAHPGDHYALPLDLSLPYLLDPDASTGCGIVIGVDDVQSGANVAMRVLPNPSRSNATVEFALTQAESVTLMVYDIGGRVVRSVFDGQLDAGPQLLTWDGKSDAGNPVADGVYFVALRTGAGTEVMRTIRLK